MQRIEFLDREMLRCIESLKDLIPFSTQSGNTNMVNAADLILRSLCQLHEEKMEILSVQPREPESPQYEYATPEPTETTIPRFALQELDDGGPLQLADLMETEDDDMSLPIHTPEYVQQSPDGINWGPMIDDLNWAPVIRDLRQDWADEPLHPNITVRVARRPICGRKTVYLWEESKLNAPIEGMCNICFETPLTKDACNTSCNHSFCKDCFSRWENACVEEITCPTCRHCRPLVTEYKKCRTASTNPTP